MSEEQQNQTAVETVAPAPSLEVAPGPHLHTTALSTRRMMADVLIALVPLIIVALAVFRMGAVRQLVVCTVAALAAEYLFNIMRRKPFSLGDGSAAVNVTDLTFMVAYLFQGGGPAGCPIQADVNASGATDVSDLTFIVQFLFQSGAAPMTCP